MFRQTEETSDESNLAEHGASNQEGEREEGARARGGKTCGSENCERASSTRSEPLLLLYCNMSAAACCGGTPRPSSSDGVHGSSVNLVQRDWRARAAGAEDGRMQIRTRRAGAGV